MVAANEQGERKRHREYQAEKTTRMPRGIGTRLKRLMFSPPAFLALAALVVLSGLFFGSQSDVVVTGGQVFQYSVDFTKTANPDRDFSSDIDIPANTPATGTTTLNKPIHVTVMTRATDPAAPADSAADVAIYGSKDGATYTVIKRLTSISASWSRWDNEGLYTHLRVKVEKPVLVQTTPATRVDVLVYTNAQRAGSGCPWISLCSLRNIFN